MKHRVPLILGGVSVALVCGVVVWFGCWRGGIGGVAVGCAGALAGKCACADACGRDAPTDRISAAACARVRCAKAAANARAGVRGKAGATTAAGGAIVSSYENVSPSFDGIYQTDGTPPDTTGAIGPDRYIEAVNTSFAIFSRSGRAAWQWLI